MATVIQQESIGVNLYAPDGYMQIQSYTYGKASGLMIGQLVIAVCCHRAAVIEASSVVKMNQVTAQSGALDELSAAAKDILDDSKSWVGTAAKAVIKQYCSDVTDEELNATLDSYNKRINLFNKIKGAMDSLSSQVQRDTVKLQSLVSRRDVSFNTSAAIVKSLGRTGLMTASSL